MLEAEEVEAVDLKPPNLEIPVVSELEAEVVNSDSVSLEVPVEELICQLRTEKYCRISFPGLLYLDFVS